MTGERQTEEERQLVHSDHPHLLMCLCACLSVCVCQRVFGLLVVNSEMNLNGHHLTLHPNTKKERSKHTHKELVHWMRNGVETKALRILSEVCLCVCERERE